MDEKQIKDIGILEDKEIDIKLAGVQPSPDFSEYRRRMIRAIEPLIRLKERQRLGLTEGNNKIASPRKLLKIFPL